MEFGISGIRCKNSHLDEKIDKTSDRQEKQTTKDNININEISNLTNEQLSDLLKSHNIIHGPITKTTRSLYETRLKKCLLVGLTNRQDCSSSVSGEVKGKNGEKLEKEEKNGESESPYYGIQLPPSAQKVECKLVFKDKKEAMNFCKEHQDARFKVFQDLKSAEQFSGDLFKGRHFTEMRDKKDLNKKSVPETFVSESCIYPSIKSPELMKFMKAIEKGELTTVMQLVKSNPRYLIGGGDKPTILQQGCRYNALHVCCKYNQLQVCKYLIDELMGVDLYVTMYPDDKWESRRMRMTFLLDYYLNNREKGVLETPLHVASKYGHVELVRYLLTIPSIDRNLRNKENLTAYQVACTRVSKKSPRDLKKQMESIFEDQYYVYVSRVEDNSEPPCLSLPFCPNLPSSLFRDITFPNTPTRDYSSEIANNVHLESSPTSSPPLRTTSRMQATISNHFMQQWLANSFSTISSSAATLAADQSVARRSLRFDDGDNDDLCNNNVDDYYKPRKPIYKYGPNISNGQSNSTITKQPTNHITPLITDKLYKQIPSLNANKPAVYSTPTKQTNESKIPKIFLTPNNKPLIKLIESSKAATCLPKFASMLNEGFSVKREESKDDCNSSLHSYWQETVMLPIFSATDLPRKIRGVAGPMSLKQAETFRSLVANNKIKNGNQKKLADIKRTDCSKGLERVCRLVAKEIDVKWVEHWDFLDLNVNLTSDQGLKLFNDYLSTNSRMLIYDNDDGGVDRDGKVCDGSKDREGDEDGDDEKDDSLVNAMEKLRIQSPVNSSSDTTNNITYAQKKKISAGSTKCSTSKQETNDDGAAVRETTNGASVNYAGDEDVSHGSAGSHCNGHVEEVKDKSNSSDDNNHSGHEEKSSSKLLIEGTSGAENISTRNFQDKHEASSTSEGPVRNPMMASNGHVKNDASRDGDVVEYSSAGTSNEEKDNSETADNQMKHPPTARDNEEEGITTSTDLREKVPSEVSQDRISNEIEAGRDKVSATLTADNNSSESKDSKDKIPSSTTDDRGKKSLSGVDKKFAISAEDLEKQNYTDHSSGKVHRNDECSSSYISEDSEEVVDETESGDEKEVGDENKSENDDDDGGGNVGSSSRISKSNNSSFHFNGLFQGKKEREVVTSSQIISPLIESRMNKKKENNIVNHDGDFVNEKDDDEKDDDDEAYHTPDEDGGDDEVYCDAVNELQSDSDDDAYFNRMKKDQSITQPPTNQATDVFIYGDVPTQSDLDAFRALEDMQYLLSPYPFVQQWHSNVLRYSELERMRWWNIDRLSKSLSFPPSSSPFCSSPVTTALKHSTPTHHRQQQQRQVQIRQQDKIIHQSLQICRNKFTLSKDTVIRNLTITFNEDQTSNPNR